MKRLVIKVGRAVITEDDHLAKERMLNLVTLVATLKKEYDVILVSSGAVAAGYSTLKLDKRKQIGRKSLAAAGQPILMSAYKAMFDIYEIATAQLLLTEDDFDSTKRTKMFLDIIDAHLENDILPIISENDMTSTPEQLFGDNDQLSAHVANAIDAHYLVTLSDIDGYYDKDPKQHKDAKLFKIVTSIPDGAIEEKKQNSQYDSGGIIPKLKAAKFLIRHGKQMLLGNGFNLETTQEFLLEGIHTKGTLFCPKEVEAKIKASQETKK